MDNGHRAEMNILCIGTPLNGQTEKFALYIHIIDMLPIKFILLQTNTQTLSKLNAHTV